MAKRKEVGIELLASIPWPIGIGLGIAGYVAIRYGIGGYLSTVNNPITQATGKQLSGGAYAPFAWFVLFACWMGAFVSYLGSRRRKRLLETQTGLDSIRAMSWREFEMLTGEAFRRQGYTVQETGLGGADGGIDLILRKNGTTTLVQCKQWRNRKVEVNVVREMYGLLVHHQASALKIVALGDYTADAHRFALGKPIELIHDDALLAMVRAVQTMKLDHTHEPIAPTIVNSITPTCPKCGTTMVSRANRNTKEKFWGCPSYPTCRGTRQVE